MNDGNQLVATRTHGDAGRPVPIRTVIRPSHAWSWLDVLEVWRRRELLYFLIWRDVKVRYKQTVIGGAWAVIQPLATMIVFSIFFGRLIGISTGNIPYPLFAYAALVPWTYFSSSLTHAGASLVAEERLITRIYFPRILIPLAPVVGNLLDVAIASLVLVGLQVYYGIWPGLAALTLPLFVLLAAATAFAFGTWLSALSVRYRDVRYTIPFLLQLWLFLTPIVYPLSVIPEQWRTLYAVNPMVGVVEGFRWALLGSTSSPGWTLVVSVVTVLAVLLTGLLYFHRVERSFADVV
jgi:lipopolysaccharide transport system permease protein